MSVLEGPRKEIRHVMKDGSAYWVEFKDGKIVFDITSATGPAAAKDGETVLAT